MERYSRQEAFFGIGREGQEKLLKSRVTIIGLGALGSASANLLARAGVGRLRIVDRDYVELSNLQRQVLYTEQDAAEAVPKAAAAVEHLLQINSGITVEPVIVDVNGGNIEGLIEDADLVIDATDNVEIRGLLNEACHALRKPWIYGGALASYGMTMNILPEDDMPCFRCLFDEQVPDGETCATAGVLGMLTSIVASIQCTEAVKILIGAGDVRRTLLAFDIWTNEFDEMEVTKNPDCPVCVRGEYEYYGKAGGTRTASLCGRDAVQIVPAAAAKVDFDEYAARWEHLGEVKRGRFTLDLVLNAPAPSAATTPNAAAAPNPAPARFAIKLFPDGRAIIHGTPDEAKARALYAEYVGL